MFALPGVHDGFGSPSKGQLQADFTEWRESRDIESTEFVFNNVKIGEPRPERRVVVGMVYGDSNERAFTGTGEGMWINGTDYGGPEALTLHSEAHYEVDPAGTPPGNHFGASIWSIEIDTAPTAAFRIIFDAPCDRVGIGVWSMYGRTSTFIDEDVFEGSSISQDPDMGSPTRLVCARDGICFIAAVNGQGSPWWPFHAFNKGVKKDFVSNTPQPGWRDFETATLADVPYNGAAMFHLPTEYDEHRFTIDVGIGPMFHAIANVRFG